MIGHRRPKPMDRASRKEVANQSPIRGRKTLVVAVLVAALAMMVAGGVLLAHSINSALVQEAEVGGLYLRLEETKWLVDQMHIEGAYGEGRVFPMPASMMPDMPLDGVQRLYVEFTLHNRSQRPKHFRATELELRSAKGAVGPPPDNQPSEVTLGPGQALNLFRSFDVVEPEVDLRLVWTRDGVNVEMPVSDSSDQDHTH